MDFQEALKAHDLDALRAIPKSDLHNHGLMGGRLPVMEKLMGLPIGKFSTGEEGIHGINKWIRNCYVPVLGRGEAFENAIRAAFLQAKSDGVTILEMSVDVSYGFLFNIPPSKMVSILDKVHREIAPDVEFRPELGFPKAKPVRSLLGWFEPMLDTGYFTSVDLYDDEAAQPIRNFRELYRFVRNSGLKCKAHAGEFGSAESVREAVEELGLEVVQHGIGAAGSPEVMKWLALNKIQLNVCPLSNIVLKRVGSYSTHPIRILYDHGVKVTINTDDVMLFDSGNSEQYLDLFRCGLFSAAELDEIRRNGL
jgi:adenosine deaminase